MWCFWLAIYYTFFVHLWNAHLFEADSSIEEGSPINLLLAMGG